MENQITKKYILTSWRFWLWTIISLFVFGVIISIIASNPQSSSQSLNSTATKQTSETATIPAKPTTLTDTEYYQQLNENVIPFSTAYGSDAKSLQTMLPTSDTADTLIYAQQAQSDLKNWKNGLQALQGRVPPDFVSINDYLNKAVDNYIQAVNIIVADLNSGNRSDTSSVPYMTHANLYMQQATTAIDQLGARLKAQ